MTNGLQRVLAGAVEIPGFLEQEPEVVVGGRMVEAALQGARELFGSLLIVATRLHIDRLAQVTVNLPARPALAIAVGLSARQGRHADRARLIVTLFGFLEQHPGQNAQRVTLGGLFRIGRPLAGLGRQLWFLSLEELLHLLHVQRPGRALRARWGWERLPLSEETQGKRGFGIAGDDSQSALDGLGRPFDLTAALKRGGDR